MMCKDYIHCQLQVCPMKIHGMNISMLLKRKLGYSSLRLFLFCDSVCEYYKHCQISDIIICQ